jgi:nitric oxide reductase subunit C
MIATDSFKVTAAILLMTAFLSYSGVLYSALPSGNASLSADAERGKSLWQKHNCTACHQIYGLGGFLGPDLTNEYSLKGPEQIKAFLTVGSATMPEYRFAPEDIIALTAYLRHIDSSGVADPRMFKINYDGTIRQH